MGYLGKMLKWSKKTILPKMVLNHRWTLERMTNFFTISNDCTFTSVMASFRLPAVLYRPQHPKGRMPAIVLTFGEGGSKSNWQYNYGGQQLKTVTGNVRVMPATVPRSIGEVGPEAS